MIARPPAAPHVPLSHTPPTHPSPTPQEKFDKSFEECDTQQKMAVGGTIGGRRGGEGRKKQMGGGTDDLEKARARDCGGKAGLPAEDRACTGSECRWGRAGVV